MHDAIDLIDRAVGKRSNADAKVDVGQEVVGADPVQHIAPFGGIDASEKDVAVGNRLDDVAANQIGGIGLDDRAQAHGLDGPPGNLNLRQPGFRVGPGGVDQAG